MRHFAEHIVLCWNQNGQIMKASNLTYKRSHLRSLCHHSFVTLKIVPGNHNKPLLPSVKINHMWNFNFELWRNDDATHREKYLSRWIHMTPLIRVVFFVLELLDWFDGIADRTGIDTGPCPPQSWHKNIWLIGKKLSTRKNRTYFPRSERSK